MIHFTDPEMLFKYVFFSLGRFPVHFVLKQNEPKIQGCASVHLQVFLRYEMYKAMVHHAS